MNIFIIGDLHGQVSPIKNFYQNFIKNTQRESEENWIICLGDFGALYSFDYRDYNFKKALSNYPFKYFVIRGNHEERASNRAKVEPDLWQSTICFENTCLYQPSFPKIYYALDEGGVYNINGNKSLIIPGAYSVDKFYRQLYGRAWFPDEQMSLFEMEDLERAVKGQKFDFVFSHTCPFRFMPTDLFLGFVDQSTVDNSMERWMDRLLSKIDWKVWCWGHFHDNRIEAPYCEMFFSDVQNLEDVKKRWEEYSQNGKLDCGLSMSPKMKQTFED